MIVASVRRTMLPVILVEWPFHRDGADGPVAYHHLDLLADGDRAPFYARDADAVFHGGRIAGACGHADLCAVFQHGTALTGDTLAGEHVIHHCAIDPLRLQRIKRLALHRARGA